MDSAPNLPVGTELMILEVYTAEQKMDAFSVRDTVFIEEQKVPAELEHDEYDNRPTTIHFVGYADGVPITAARLRPYQEEVGKVERVAVLSNARGRGIGAALMKVLERKAANLGYKKLKLNAQLHAAPFYTRLGYKEFGEIFLDAGIDHIAMEKVLD